MGRGEGKKRKGREEGGEEDRIRGEIEMGIGERRERGERGEERKSMT